LYRTTQQRNKTQRNNPMNLRVTKLDPRAVIPEYKSTAAAAFDLTVIEDAIVPAHGQVLLKTGLGFGIPEGHVMLIFSRSSTFMKFGIVLANGVGVIDSDYSGEKDELLIAALNPGMENISIQAGSRVAQAMIMARPDISFVEGPAGDINRGSFGSTGGHGTN
jgi:dUTP pyrophosphatase